MPSDGSADYTGRCYCGATTLKISSAPVTVAYCHCRDCRRWTGGPVGAFAAFDRVDFTTDTTLPAPFSAVKGVERWTCATCHSPIAAAFDYIPGQIYVPLGILDQADQMPPEIHCHADKALLWLKISDDLARVHGSARDDLNAAGDTP